MPFPCALSGSVAEKFANRAADLERELYPVLHVGDRPTLGAMMEAASAFVDEHVAPKQEEEHEYLRQLDVESRYEPSLLFSEWPDVLERAERSPAAAWKVTNLSKRPAEPPSDYPEW